MGGARPISQALNSPELAQLKLTQASQLLRENPTNQYALALKIFRFNKTQVHASEIELSLNRALSIYICVYLFSMTILIIRKVKI